MFSDSEFNIFVRTDSGSSIPCKGNLVFEDQSGLWETDMVSCDEHGGLSFSLAPDWRNPNVCVQPLARGYWSVYYDDCEDCEELSVPALPDPSAAWWYSRREQAGAGGTGDTVIRVGIVDTDGEALRHNTGLTFDAVPPRMDGAKIVGASSPRILTHGEAVARCLMGGGHSRLPDSVEICFCSIPSADGSLDENAVVEAIRRLIMEFQADIVNLSLGYERTDPNSAGFLEHDRPLTNIVDLAAELGVVSVVACGNEGSTEVSLPACLDSTIGVGAYGKRSWGPENSTAQHFARKGDTFAAFDPFFGSSENNLGDGLDAMAPGVGIVVFDDEGAPIEECYGSSFAAPLLVRALVEDLTADAEFSALPRSAERLSYVRRVLDKISSETNVLRGTLALPVKLVGADD